MCVCLSCPRLPHTQDCHEMWSRKRRKKEAKSGAGGGGGGKEGRSGSQPPTHPPSPRHTVPNRHTPTATRSGNPTNSSIPSSPTLPPPPPPPSSTPPQTHPPPLANPNLKPGLTVPPPPAPINPAALLDSIKSSLLHEAPPPPVAMGTSGPPINSMGSLPAVSMVAGSSSSVTVAQQQSDQLQRVIEAQRTQLNLLSQITKTLADQQRHSTNSRGGPSVTRPGVQTFDYGNRSSAELQSLALKQLEQDYSIRGRWP